MEEINIAKIVMKKRKEKKMTQEDLANYLGVSKAAISKWETGQSYPDLTLLPIIAAYFDLSIDELIGYEPQMDKSEIRVLYQRLCHDFTKKLFDEVIMECQQIVRRYYSCYPLLLHIGLLIINHSMLELSQTQSLNQWAKGLFERVKTNSEDVDLAKQAQTFEALCYLLLNQPIEALTLLEGCQKPIVSGELLQAKAYQMIRQEDEAKKTSQIALYKSLMVMMESFEMLISLSDEKQLDTLVEKFMTVVEVFALKESNSHSLMSVFHLIAKKYLVFNQVEKALDYLEEYSKLGSSFIYPARLRGSLFFNHIEQWFETFDLGTLAPRDDEMIKQGIKDALMKEPLFTSLHENERFIQLVKRLGA